MFTVKYFEEQYKSFSNSELLEILESPAQYQQIAITAARNELNFRNLSGNEIDDAKQVLVQRKRNKLKEKESSDLLINKVNKAGIIIHDTLNPLNTTSLTTLKILRLVTVTFGLLLIFKVTNQYSFFKSLILEKSKEQYGITFYLIPLIILFFATFLFGLKRQAGWRLLVFFCSFSFVDVVFNLYYSITALFDDNSFHFIRTPSPMAYIIALLFFTGTIFALSKKEMMEVYKVDKNKKEISIITGGLFGLLYAFLSVG